MENNDRAKNTRQFRLNDDMRATPWLFRSTNNHCLLHYHQCVELVYVISGQLSTLINGKVIIVHAGELLICSSYMLHSYSTPEKTHNSVIVAVYPLDFVPVIRSALKNHCYSQILVKNPPQAVIDALSIQVDQCSKMSTETQRSLSQFILGMLIDTIGLTAQHFSDTSNITRTILVYLQSNFTNNITLSDLAAEVNYSCGRLSHLFHDHFHCTFTDYLNALRCRHAVQLLNDNDMTVLEISMASGFESVRTFYRAFSRIYGMPPLKYRKEQKMLQQKRSEDDH